MCSFLNASEVYCFLDGTGSTSSTAFDRDFPFLRAAACKYQTSPDSSKKSTSFLFHEKNPYIELFSKMEFKGSANFIFREIELCPLSPRQGLALSSK